MDRGELVILLLLGAAAYWLLNSQAGAQPGASSTAAADTPFDTVDTLSDGSSTDGDIWDTIVTDVSSIVNPGSNNVQLSTLQNPNLQAFLQLIRTGEGTLGDSGYSEFYGGGHFGSFVQHPDVAVTAGNYTSTAAGAYQILFKTWTGLQAQYPSILVDFSPQSQDFAAMALISGQNALNDVINGNWITAITKCNPIWASLPGSKYGQPTLTMAKALSVIAANGGSAAATV